MPWALSAPIDRSLKSIDRFGPEPQPVAADLTWRRGTSSIPCAFSWLPDCESKPARRLPYSIWDCLDRDPKCRMPRPEVGRGIDKGARGGQPYLLLYLTTKRCATGAPPSTCKLST